MRLDPGSRHEAVPERLLKRHFATFDWNCPKHITPRYTEAEIAAAVAPPRARVAALDAENGTLRAKRARQGD